MITYYAGSTFNQVINEVISSTDPLMFPPVVSATNEIDFQKSIRQNISQMDGIDILVLDETACKNTEDELITTLEMLRTMYDEMRIVLFTPYREEGDDFLTRCFNMGILNIISTSDFLEIREELNHCIREGKTYREAAKYKESKKEKVVVRHEVKRSVNKRMIGISGTESNIGVTHNAIVLANFFRKKGFMVALVEMNQTGAFDKICEDYEEKKFQEGYFTLNGVDFYANCTPEKLLEVMEHSYNVILLDFGCYGGCDRIAFERCEDRIIISGSKSWELDACNLVFMSASKDVLLKYIFCFNFTQESDYAAIKEGMRDVDGPGIENVFFLKYTSDPFYSSDFADAEVIFADILPEKEEESEKFIKGIMRKMRAKKADDNE